MLKVAMLSGWHVHAKGYANTVNSFPDAKVTVVWDEEPARGRAWAAELSVPFEPDLKKCVARDDVDGVVVDAPTSMHPEVMSAAARAGKHSFTEKVMALTVRDATASRRRMPPLWRRPSRLRCLSTPSQLLASRPRACRWVLLPACSLARLQVTGTTWQREVA